MTHRSRLMSGVAVSAVVILSIAAFTGAPPADQDQVLRGRFLVLSHACGDCHGGGNNPAASGFLVGLTTPQQEFRIGPCAAPPQDACFKTRPRNLTPDNTTGLGRFSERQI